MIVAWAMWLALRIIATVGILGIAFSVVCQVIALGTYLQLIDAHLAMTLTIDAVMFGGLLFVGIWSVNLKRLLERPRSHPDFLAGTRPVLRRLNLVFIAYWMVTFVGLIVLGGIANKGVDERQGHFYMRRPYPEAPVEISQTEYQHQVAYPLWMASAWSLWTSMAILSLSAENNEDTG